MSEKIPLSKTIKSRDFDGVFTEVKHSESLGLCNPNQVCIYHLNIENNAFSFEGLNSFLQSNIGRYVFSRAQINQFKMDDDEESIGLKAIELLRKIKSTDDKGAGGELGEILLYIFLEQILGAPKLLSKVELKTATNDYVKGSDGIHLWSGSDSGGQSIYQLVLGESKIKGDLTGAITEAFKSIRNVIANPTNEVRLVESNIFKEAYTAEQAEYIKSLIIPEKRGNKQLDKAFGIFIGYSVNLNPSGLSNSEYRAAVTKKLEQDIKDCTPNIIKRINEKSINGTDLSGYSFYFYVLPFNKADDDRRSIIERLIGGGAARD